MEDNGRGDIGNGRYIYKTWSTRRLFYTSGTHSISDKSVESAPEWRVRDAVPSWRAVEAEDFRSVRLESIMHHSTGKSCVNELSWTSESSRFFLSLSLSPPSFHPLLSPSSCCWCFRGAFLHSCPLFLSAWPNIFWKFFSIRGPLLSIVGPSFFPKPLHEDRW